MSYPRHLSRSQSVPAVEIDEEFKHSLRKRIEYKLQDRFYHAREQRDAALRAAQDEEEHNKALRAYEENMSHLKVLAEEEYQTQIRHEIAARSGAERRHEPEPVEQQQQV